MADTAADAIPAEAFVEPEVLTVAFSATTEDDTTGARPDAGCPADTETDTRPAGAPDDTEAP